MGEEGTLDEELDILTEKIRVREKRNRAVFGAVLIGSLILGSIIVSKNDTYEPTEKQAVTYEAGVSYSSGYF